MKIIIIVLNWNGKHDTIQCLASLKALTTAHSVLVVDNGSTDDSALEIARAFPDVEVIATGSNLGYAEGNNVGLRHALKNSPDAILILNNDTVVEPNLLSAFLKRDLPIQGGSLVQMSNPERLDHIGGMWNIKTGRFDLVAFNALASECTEPLSLDYLCDWCYRAAKAGYRATLWPEATVHHRGSASFVGGVPHTTYYWWRNRLLWMELHCSKEERRRQIWKMLPELILTFRRYLVKSLQRCFSKSTLERRLRLGTYRATLAGVRDYFLRRFGAGPRWLVSPEFRASPAAAAGASQPEKSEGVRK